jgi:glycerol uptake facilitator-like aquaporin
VETTRAAAAEMIGAFAIVLIGAGATITSGFGLDLTGVGLASGLAYAVMISVTLHLGGGALNPAISLGLWVVGMRSTPRTVVVVVAQLAGAVLAGLLLRSAIPGTPFDAADGGTPAVAAGIATGKAIVIEAASAFLLSVTFLATVVDERGPRGLAGFPVGLLLAVAIMAFAPSTGAALNPARWFGPALASGSWADWYVWIVGPTAGAIIGSAVYATVFLRDRVPETP